LQVSQSEIEKSGIKIERVGQHAMAHLVIASGGVQYNQNYVAQLSSRVAGNVWRVEKQVGHSVRKGDVLALIESLDVGRAKAEFLQAIVDSDTKAKTLERLNQVNLSIPERQIRDAEALLREARIRLFNSQQTLVNLGLPISLDEVKGAADDVLARRIQFLGLPKSVCETLDPASTTGNLVPLVAPFDGVVIGRAIVVGEVVSPAEATFVVADVRRMWILLDVRKEDANLVRLGQNVAFSADGIPGQVQGQIDWISTEVDQYARTLQVRAEVNNPSLDSTVPAVDSADQGERRLLRARTFGTGEIRIRDNPQAVVVPSEAVQFDGVSHIVFVRDGDLFRRREVQPGAVRDGQTEIVTGLKPDEMVATVGSHVLKAGLQLAASRR
jgi:cobalt-zinc-cadmium efflux system membrane fusion protein